MFPSKAGLMTREVLGPQAGALAPRATGHRRLRKSGRLSRSSLGRSPWTDIKKVEIFEDSTGAAPARFLVKLRDSPDQVLSFMAPALGVEEGCTLTRVAMQLIKGAKAADLKAGRKEK